tara:strand:- start:89 stop:400 length:312 start_codon:yes stop_codon:yes gene_type:complete
MVEKLLHSLSDIVERAASTAAQAAVGVIIATQATDEIGFSWLLIVVATAASAFLSVIKGSVASQFGDRSASLLTELGIARDEKGRFTSRRVSFESEEVKRNGD